MVTEFQLLQLIHNRFTKCVLTQGGGLVSKFIPSANDDHLIMVTAQPQEGVDQTCNKYIHDHVDIHAMAQTTGVE